MAIKMDLEKAYDWLSWDFILWTLKEIGCLLTLLELLWIMTASMQIIWNEETAESFAGIRQGDPISSYIFVLCIERLSREKHEAVNRGHWKAIKLAHGGTLLTHLFFVEHYVFSWVLGTLAFFFFKYGPL